MTNSVDAASPANAPDRTRVISYAPALRSDDRVVRQFELPELQYAVEPIGPAAELDHEATTTICFFSSKKRRPEQSTASRSIDAVSTREGIAVHWSPGAIDVEAPLEQWDALLPALLDFDHLARELERLERPLADLERQASADVRLAYRIRHQDRRHWDRLGTTMEFLARQRLTFAKLEPLAAQSSTDLTPTGRRLFRSLIRNATLAPRLESLSDRSEALEDLYEGAVDRINDHRYWRDGHWLEVIIIVLLSIEAVMIAVELFHVVRDMRVE